MKIDKKKVKARKLISDGVSVNTRSVKSTLDQPREDDDFLEEDEAAEEVVEIGEQLAQNKRKQKEYERTIKKLI